MTQVRVLFVGLEPTAIDFTSPEYAAPGLDAAKIQAGIDGTMARLRELGYDAEFCPVDTGETADMAVRMRLAARRFDCVVIGAGIRLFASRTPLLETLVNAVHAEAPAAKFAFNTTPGDTAEAVQRLFPQPGSA